MWRGGHATAKPQCVQTWLCLLAGCGTLDKPTNAFPLIPEIGQRENRSMAQRPPKPALGFQISEGPGTGLAYSKMFQRTGTAALNAYMYGSHLE